jgi:hypothetical protein
MILGPKVTHTPRKLLGNAPSETCIRHTTRGQNTSGINTAIPGLATDT